MLRATSAIVRPSSMTNSTALALYSSVKRRRVDPIAQPLPVGPAELHHCPLNRERSILDPAAKSARTDELHRPRRPRRTDPGLPEPLQRQRRALRLEVHPPRPQHPPHAPTRSMTPDELPATTTSPCRRSPATR